MYGARNGRKKDLYERRLWKNAHGHYNEVWPEAYMTRCETVRARRVVERKKTHPPALAGIATDSSSHVGKIASCSSLARRSSQMYAPPATVKTATQNDGPLGQAQRQFEERVRFAGGDHLVVDLG